MKLNKEVISKSDSELRRLRLLAFLRNDEPACKADKYTQSHDMAGVFVKVLRKDSDGRVNKQW